jgi:transcriptional regulator with XRE-family HTH domain
MASNALYLQIGERIKALRIQLGMTQSDLAEKAGISVSFLSFLESGNRKGSLETYHQLSLALGIGLYELFKSKKTKSAFEKNRFADLSIAESKAVYRLVRSLRGK